MIVKNGKFGKFYGCIQYPNCNGSMSMDQTTKQPKVSNALKIPSTELKNSGNYLNSLTIDVTTTNEYTKYCRQYRTLKKTGAVKQYYYCGRKKEHNCQFAKIVVVFPDGTQSNEIVREHSCPPIPVIHRKSTIDIDTKIVSELEKGKSTSEVVIHNIDSHTVSRNGGKS